MRENETKIKKNNLEILEIEYCFSKKKIIMYKNLD